MHDRKPCLAFPFSSLSVHEFMNMLRIHINHPITDMKTSPRRCLQPIVDLMKSKVRSNIHHGLPVITCEVATYMMASTPTRQSTSAYPSRYTLLATCPGTRSCQYRTSASRTNSTRADRKRRAKWEYLCFLSYQPPNPHTSITPIPQRAVSNRTARVARCTRYRRPAVYDFLNEQIDP